MSGLEVTAVADGVFRVGLFRDGRPAEYASPALAAAVQEGMRLETPSGSAHVAEDSRRVHFTDPDGVVFAADDADPGFAEGRPRLVKRREAG